MATTQLTEKQLEEWKKTTDWYKAYEFERRRIKDSLYNPHTIYRKEGVGHVIWPDSVLPKHYRLVNGNFLFGYKTLFTGIPEEAVPERLRA